MSHAVLPRPFNIADHFIRPRAEGAEAERPCLVVGDQALSYRALDERARRVAAGLRALGVEPEQRVVMLMGESLSFPACFWGAVRAGAVAVPVNTALLPADYRHILADSRARVLMVDEALWPRVQDVCDGLRHLRHVVVAEGRVPGRPALADWLADGNGGRDGGSEPMHPDDAAFWLYTSGSTGEPKAAVHLHRDLVTAADGYPDEVLGLGPEDVTFSAAKMFFAYGMGNTLVYPLSHGCTAVARREPPSPEGLFGTIERHRVTVFYGVPAHYHAMLAAHDGWREAGRPAAELPRLDSLRLCVSAGESLPAETYRRWRERFGVEILDGIGTTEVFSFFLSNRPGRVKPGSTGFEVPGFRVRLTDEAGREVPEGEPGSLQVRGDSIAARYWNRHDLTRRVMQGEWVLTGDRFLRDTDGWYWYLGRDDDMMKVGGSWVSPVEVESALLSHPDVAECAVVGLPDEHGLTQAKAYVVPHAGGGPAPPAGREEALRRHLGGELAAFKIPRWIEFVAELPRTATGKIRRFRLRERG